MAITVKGIDSIFALTEWNEVEAAQSAVAPSPDGVLSGLAVSIATGDRLLSVSAGEWVVPGSKAISDEATTVQLDTYTGTPRIDTIVAQINRSGTRTNAGSIIKLTGTPGATPVPQTLTRTYDGIWQTPRAYYLLGNGTPQLVSGSLTPVYNQADTGFVTLSLPQGFESTGQAWSVRKRGGLVEMAGALRRATSAPNIAAGATRDFGILPPDFWPGRDVAFDFSSDLSGTKKSPGLHVSREGVMTFYAGTTATTSGDVLRPNHVWLTA